MRIKIFIASSISLESSRDKVSEMAREKNKKLHDNGIFLDDFRYELDGSGAITPYRGQDEFNKKLLESDIAIVLIYDKLGKFTREEFDVAFKSNQEGKNPKLLYVYFKKAQISIDDIDKPEVKAVKELKDEICKHEKIYNTYENDEDLYGKFNKQLDEAIEEIINKKSETTTDTDKPTPTAPNSNLDKINNHVKNYSKGDKYLDVNNNIEKIEKILNEKKSVSVVSFHGMGGVGKSTLAVEYANTMLDRGKYDYTVWFNVENGVDGNYKEFVTDFLIPSDDGKQPTGFYKNRFENFVKERPKTLIILDNYVENSFKYHDLLAFVQEFGDRDILITSRKQINTFDKIDVTVFANADEALRMFLMSSTRTYDESEKEQIKEITKVLGFLPLAIEIAAKFLTNRTSIKVADYLEQLKKQTVETLERAQEQDLPQIHKEKIKATFKVNQGFDGNSKTLELMNIFALLAPDEISEEILSFIITNGFELGEALSELVGYSYIRQNGDEYSMHRLLQEALREELGAGTPENIAKISIAFFDWMKKCLDDGKYEKYFEKYIPHVEYLKQMGGENGYDESIIYLNTYMSAYTIQVSPSIALELSKLATELSENIQIDNNRKVIVLVQYARALEQNAKYDDALVIYKKALEILEDLTDDNSLRNTATIYHNIGSVYHAKGERDKALEQYEKSLKICLATIGENHPDTAMTYNNIGSVYHAKGERDKALEQYEKSLKICLATIGENHPDTAMTYNNIGSVYHAKGERDKALEQYEKSLKIKLATIGENHPDTATTYHNKGFVYRDKKSYTNAFKAVAKATEIYLKLEKSHLSAKNISKEVDSLNRIRNYIAKDRPDASQKNSINKQIVALKNLAKQNGYEKLVKIDKLT